MSKKFDERRDQQTADTGGFSVGFTPELMCQAKGCPNRWSVSIGHLCCAHYGAEPVRWPEITQVQQWEETERARMRGMPKDPPPWPLTKADKVEILHKLRGLFAKPPEEPLAWAHALRRRERNGERLTIAQRGIWRAALRMLESDPA